MTGDGNAGHGDRTINLLLVDDEAAVRGTMERIARSLGFACTPAASVREALARCRLKHYDMALIDVLMPGNDGIELLMRLKKLLPAMPVFVMSDGGRTGTQDFLTLARQLGAHGVFTKPVDAKAFRTLADTAGRSALPASGSGGDAPPAAESANSEGARR